MIIIILLLFFFKDNFQNKKLQNQYIKCVYLNNKPYNHKFGNWFFKFVLQNYKMFSFS